LLSSLGFAGLAVVQVAGQVLPARADGEVNVPGGAATASRDSDPLRDEGASRRSPAAIAGPPEVSPKAITSQVPTNEKLDLEDILFRPQSSPTSTGSVVTPSANAGSAPTSVGDLLEQALGVSARRTSAINMDARVRGFHSGQLNATANGTNQLKTRIDIDSLFSQVDPGIVERISVIQGPYTSLYGPGFAFLVADLFPAERFDCGPEFHGSMIFSHESNGRQVYNRERLWGGGADWGFNLSYGLRSGNDYRSGGDSDDFRIPASYHEQDIFLALSKDLSCDSRIEFNYIRQDLRDVELPGVAYDIDRSETDQFNLRYVVQEDRRGPENLIVQVWSQQTPYNVDASHSSKQRTFSRFFAAQPFALYYPAIATGDLTTILLGEGLSESSGIRSLVTMGDADSVQLTLGADFRRYEQFYRERDFDGDGTPAFSGNIYGIPRSTQEDFGLLAHLSAPLCDQTTVTLGGRVDRTASFVDSSDPVAQVIDPGGEGIFRPGFKEPNEILGMGYTTAEMRPTSWLTLNTSVAYAMRGPNLAELYSDEPFVPVVRFGNSYTDGNSDLDPERMLQFDVGATGKWDRLTLGTRGYYSSIHDYILAVPSNFSTPVPAGTGAPSRLGRNFGAFGIDPADPTIEPGADTTSLDYRYSNIERVSLCGAEMFTDIALLPCLSLHGTLSFVEGTNHSRVRYDDFTGRLVPMKGDEPLPGIYPLNSTVALRLFDHEDHRWSFEFESRFVDGQDDVADSLAELPTPGFGVFNLHGFYQLTDKIRMFSSVENLFDRTYFEHGSLAIVNRRGEIGFVKEPGFTWTIGVEARF
jgi:outer membrane receptor protein involved in Fe transport